MNRVLLCDGHNLAFRAFYGIPELSRSDGFPTNMIHGWIKSFWRLEDEFKPDEVCIFFDKGGSPRREELLPQYKSNRGPPPNGFLQQLEWIKKIISSMGYFWHEDSGFEADDLIASAVRLKAELTEEILIVSADKDLAQLVRPGVKLLVPPPTANSKLGWKILDEDGVREKFGVPPSRVLDYLCIIGDQSDNIPGLYGVGPKTAAKWLMEYGDIERLIENAGRLTPRRFCSVVYEKKAMLVLNRELIKLEDNLEFEIIPRQKVDLPKLDQILLELEMINSLKEAERRYA